MKLESNEDIDLAKMHKKQRWCLFGVLLAAIFVVYLIAYSDATDQASIVLETNSNIDTVLAFAPSNERTAYLTRTKEILDGKSISKWEDSEMLTLYKKAQEAETVRKTTELKEKTSKKIHENL